MAVNTELVEISAMIGTVVPPIAAVLKQDRYSRRTNALITAALALVAATVTVAVQGRLSPASVVVTFVVVYTVAVAFHYGLWEPTGIARAVQVRTVFRRPATPLATPKAGAKPQASATPLPHKILSRPAPPATLLPPITPKRIRVDTHPVNGRRPDLARC